MFLGTAFSHNAWETAVTNVLPEATPPEQSPAEPSWPGAPSDRVIFLHRLAPGPADQSYGINVAQMAGMPPQVVGRAKEILSRLEKEQIDTVVETVKTALRGR